jgi:hypothetical protein
LPLAPMDLRLNQRLVALHTRASRFTEAAVCCRNLQSLYHEAGYPDEATRYGELGAMYEERAGLSATDAASGVPVSEHEIVLKGDPIPPFESTSDFDVAPEVHAATHAVEVPAQKASKPKGLFFHAPSVTPQSEAKPPVAADFSVPTPVESEIDLSEEWEGGTVTEEPSSAPAAKKAEPAAVDEAAVSEAIEEMRFYLMHNMVDQAQEAFVKLATLKKDPVLLSAMRAEIEAAINRPAAAPVEAVEEISVEDVPVAEVAMAVEEAAIPTPEPATLDAFVSDLESSLGADFPAPPALPEPVQPTIPEPEPEPRELVAHAEATAEPVQAGELGEFVADLEASLGDGFMPEAPPAPATPQAWPHPAVESQPVVQTQVAVTAQTPAPPVTSMPASAGAAAATAPAQQPLTAPAVGAQPAAPSFIYGPTKIRPLAPAPPAGAVNFDAGAGVDLADMFGDLKHELEEDSANSDEDPETHYNLGVAFREMGLLDEAIGELQKVCQAVERGHAFQQIMQTYTWLAQCFLDKGVPEAAIRWYEAALKLPDVDQDTRMALHYELGTSYEAAQNKPAALQHFMDVYGSNIDYRDVSEHIKALKS